MRRDPWRVKVGARDGTARANGTPERSVVRSGARDRTPHDRTTPSLEEDRMTYVIAEPCIDVLDISCVSVCPVDCIHYEEGVDRKLFIDPNECIDCGACEPECPVNAIFPEESLPPEWANYTVIDATWYTDKAAARASVDELKPPG
jgi:ferredoxin